MTSNEDEDPAAAFEPDSLAPAAKLRTVEPDVRKRKVSSIFDTSDTEEDIEPNQLAPPAKFRPLELDLHGKRKASVFDVRDGEKDPEEDVLSRSFEPANKRRGALASHMPLTGPVDGVCTDIIVHPHNRKSAPRPWPYHLYRQPGEPGAFPIESASQLYTESPDYSRMPHNRLLCDAEAVTLREYLGQHSAAHDERSTSAQFLRSQLRFRNANNRRSDGADDIHVWGLPGSSDQETHSGEQDTVRQSEWRGYPPGTMPVFGTKSKRRHQRMRDTDVTFDTVSPSPSRSLAPSPSLAPLFAAPLQRQDDVDIFGCD